jgi:hypothetical protein
MTLSRLFKLLFLMGSDDKAFQLKYQVDSSFSGSLDKYAFVSISFWLIPCCGGYSWK